MYLANIRDNRIIMLKIRGFSFLNTASVYKCAHLVARSTRDTSAAVGDFGA